MSCAGQTGPAGETVSQKDCREAWYAAVNDAWGKWNSGFYSWAQLQAALDAANTAFKGCH